MSSDQQLTFLFNDEITWPDDLYLVLGCTFGWFILHTVFNAVIKPLSIVLVPDTPDASTSSSNASKDSSVNTASEKKTGKADQQLRSRKQGNSKTPQESTDAVTETKSKKKKKNSKYSDRLKFQVAAWKFVTYASCSSFGMWVLWNEVWVTQPRMYFEDWPQWRIGDWVRIYYAVGFSQYLYGMITVFLEPAQSDFMVMIVHHVATLSVLAASYFIKMTRIGSVILLLHDVSDPFMEIAKCFLYCKMQRFADTFFALFAGVFIYTRNYLFPQIIYGIFIYGDDADGKPRPFLWNFSIVCLCVLEVLHIYWAALILHMIYKVLIDKKVEGDVRDLQEDD